jgi:hypothetical protein
MSNCGVDLLASVRQILRETKDREIKTALNFKTISIVEKQEQTEKPCLIVSNVANYLHECWHSTLSTNPTVDDSRFNGEIWIGLGGDNGGGSTKLTFSFLNVEKPHSVKNVHILGMLCRVGRGRAPIIPSIFCATYTCLYTVHTVCRVIYVICI